jgi:quercetin dioxygenase-like cupin family protein
MKPESVVTLPGTESVWTMGPGRSAALKLQNTQTNQSVMAFEEVTPAGVETPLHLHRDSDEIMYVLSGEYLFTVGERTESGGPGSVVFMPRGVGHAWKCLGPDTGRALFLYTPGTAGGVFEEATKLQIQAPTTPDEVDPQMDQLFERFGWEVLGPPPFAS